MTDWPSLSLVATPDVGATVLYAFHTSLTSFTEVGVDVGVPEWTGEPGQVVGEDGFRKIKFTHYVSASDSSAVTAMATLSRLLTASSGWLLIHPRASSAPTWARVWRSTPAALSWDGTRVDGGTATGFYAIEVELTADPYLYGAKITESPVTVNNDPASGTNPCRMILSTVLGDAPTPLEIRANPSNSTEMVGFKWMLSLHSGATQRLPVVWQFGTSDGFTAGTDTSAASADATFSGGSYRPVTFATDATLVTRLSGSVPSAPTPGRYKVLVRVGRSDVSSTFSLRFAQVAGTGLGATVLPGETKQMVRSTTQATGHVTWVDLGDFTFPFGVDPVDAAQGTAATPIIQMQAARLSGSGSARLDCLLLVPLATVDTVAATTLFSDFPLRGIETGTGAGVWDGSTERFWSLDNSGVVTGVPTQLSGGFPYAFPGASNVLTVLQQVNAVVTWAAVSGSPSDAPDVITTSTSVTVIYRPRWLWPRQ